MQLRPLQEHIVEKVLRDKTGRLARVYFHVYEHDGRLRGRIVDIIYLEESSEYAPIHQKTVLTLSGHAPASPETLESMCQHGFVVSPFATSNLLFKIGSQPRAPAVE